jgi:predicted oxidoreductase (fatty acid repression mutant protein)
MAQDETSRTKTGAKIAGFKAAYGTVLFFTDDTVVKDYEKQFPAMDTPQPDALWFH